MENYKKLLEQFINFKSISTDSLFKDDCINCSSWLKDLFNSYGFSVKIVENEQCNPVVFASYDTGSTETVCVYGHYDVQPADSQPWTYDAFSIFEDDDYLYARGVVDNKGQVLIHMVNVFEAIKNNSLSKNVLFVLEGNEESGNPVLPEILKQNLPNNISYTIISDGEVIGSNPAVELSLRGGFNMKINITTADSDVHSGIFGGAIPNASEELVKLLEKIKNKNGEILIPGFYDNIIQFPKLYSPKDAGISPVELLKSLGIGNLKLEKGTDFYNQTGCLPTIQVTGINTGYTAQGFANIIPANAEARLNIRIVAGQNANEMIKSIEDFFIKNTPKYCKLEIDKTDSYDAILLDSSSSNLQDIEILLEEAFSKKVVYTFVGGGIPIVNDFLEITQKDVFLIPLGNDDCNMHGHNEKLSKNILEKSFKFSQLFWNKRVGN